MSNQINIAVGADIADLQQGLRAAVSTMEKSGRDMGSVAESVSRLTDSKFKTISQAYRQTSRDAEVLALHLGTESDAFKQAAQMAQVYGSQLQDVRSKIAGVDGSGGIQKAAGGFNMLGNSINQITRELPAFTYSMQTGFMAISNNIPIFVDQIESIKRANASLIAQGQPVQSVFKQIATSIFSFQTALSLGVTVLTVFGAEIVNFFTGVQKSAKELEKLAEAQQKLNEKVRDYLMTGQQKAIFEEEQAHKEVTDAIKSRIKSTQILEDQYGRVSTSIKRLTLEEILANEKAKEDLQLAEIRHQENILAIKNRYATKTKKEEQFSGIDPIKAMEMKENLELFRAEYEANNPFDPIRIDALNLSATMPSMIKAIPDSFTKMTETIGGELNKVGVFFDELGLKVGGWEQMVVMALTSASAAFGAALVSGNLEDAGKAIVQMLGGIAIQIGAAMIAMGVPMLFSLVTKGQGIKLIAGGVALGVVGGAMQASGRAIGGSGSGGGGGFSGGGGGQSFNPVFAGGSQYLMLDSRVRGTDIIISADNQRRQNGRIR
jgi:hypothetical protein